MNSWKTVWILLGAHLCIHCGPKPNHALYTSDPLPLLRVWCASRADTRQMLTPESPKAIHPKQKSQKATALFRSRRGTLIPLAAHSQLQAAKQSYNAEQWPHELRKKRAPPVAQVDTPSATTESPSQKSGGVCALFLALLSRLLSFGYEHIT